jgi:hypothetical protein
MTIWDWIAEYEAQARASGDFERARMAGLHSDAYEFRQTDPDRMLAILDEGRHLAVAFREPWWVLFFDHWRLETFIYYKDDYREVIDLAVKATLELRKPTFEGYPLRFAIWCNLVAAYLCVDPRGHETAIRAAIEYLQTQVPGEGGECYLLQARRHWFAYELGRYDEAEALAMEELAMCDSDPDHYTGSHHEVDTYKALCWIAYRRGDYEALAGRASVGEERARQIRYRYELAVFLLWRALCARRAGREEEARRCFRQGTAGMARLGQPPGESYYDASCAYHELAGDLENAWALRQRELAETLGKGQLAYECQVYLKRCRLLARLGRPLAEETAAARAAASRLRAPGWYLERLERILAGHLDER